MTCTRVNEIDLLRFLAALAVMFFHYAFRGYAADGLSVMPYPYLEPVAKYGYLGVELFFMISGFVILMTAAGSSRFRDFCISRFVRLYPAFWICCTITFAATVAFGSLPDVTFEQYAINMTMLSGLLNTQPIDGAYWSLLVEIRFYALVGLVLAAGLIRQAERFLAVWLLACIALELHAGLRLNWIPASALHYLSYLLIADYATYFIAGAICYLVWSKGASPARFVTLCVAWALAIFQSVPSTHHFEKSYQTDLNNGIVMGILTAFFLTMLLVSLRRTGLIANYRWPLLGAVSYPLYLLHQNLGYIIFNHLYSRINAHVLFWATVVIMIGAAYVLHVALERSLALRMKTALAAIADGRLPSIRGID